MILNAYHVISKQKRVDYLYNNLLWLWLRKYQNFVSQPLVRGITTPITALIDAAIIVIIIDAAETQTIKLIEMSTKIRGAMIHFSLNTIHISIWSSWYNMYRDTYFICYFCTFCNLRSNVKVWYSILYSHDMYLDSFFHVMICILDCCFMVFVICDVSLHP